MNLILGLLRAFKGLVGVLQTESGEYLVAENGSYIQFDEVEQ